MGGMGEIQPSEVGAKVALEYVSWGKSGTLRQCQNYCIRLSIWTLVARLVSYIKAIFQRVHLQWRVPSPPFSLSPVSAKERVGGV